MAKHWLSFFFGQAVIKVIGDDVETFINRCLQNDVDISNIQRVSVHSIVCTVKTEDVGKLRMLLRESHCKFHVMNRKGIPFYLRKLSFKKGFVAGMVLFATLLFILSNMVWHIQVVGADPQVEQKVRQVLDDIGVKNGKFQPSLPAEEDIQYAINERVNKVAWVGVKLQGTTYTFRIVEKEVPEKKEGLTPRNLVAKKKAVIHEMYVEQGEPKVKADDYVKKGDVLVSGKIGDEDHHKIVPAKGKIRGETWYETSVTMPLSAELETYTGERTSEHAIEIFGLRIPYWGFLQPDYNDYDVKTNKTPWRILGWQLPIAFEKKTYLQTEKNQHTYTKKQAIQKAKKVGENDLQAKLGKDSEIKSGKILRQSMDNDKVKVLFYFTVIENIAAEKPLVKNKETE